jgi:pyridoxal phosphate enzyme (YggS family)
VSTVWIARIQPELEKVQERIASATARSGRSAETVKIIAISKGQPAEAIEAVVELGISHVGENRVDEALAKQAQLSHLNPTWHMVGHIQSRKAKDIPLHFSWVHSIDRVKIADRISSHAIDQGKLVSVLLECNLSGESSKEGWNLAGRSSWPSVVPELQQILALPGLEVAGLMTMAPWVQDESILRSTFEGLRELRDYLSKTLDHDLPELSMGMTDDFEYAIEEGATMVRLGRAIFGQR